MKESELAKLGIFRIPVPVPFPQAGGPANVYLIEEQQGFLLFDTGLGTESSCKALEDGLAQTGHRLKEVTRIILSHGHIDHFGAAAWIQEQAGRKIPISIHAADASKVLASGANWPTLLRQNKWYFSHLGVPESLIDETAAMLARGGGLGKQLEEVTPLVPGEKIRCKHVCIEVLHMPGHTWGLCCLYDPDHKLFFSADHLLEHISPNPLMELHSQGQPLSFKPLVAYFKSIEKVRALDIDLVLPGHAVPFHGHLRVIESLLDFYQRRQLKLLTVLEGGPLTVYQAMKELFSSGNGFELILMISETLGNLEVLEEKGKVKREKRGNLFLFHKAD